MCNFDNPQDQMILASFWDDPKKERLIEIYSILRETLEPLPARFHAYEIVKTPTLRDFVYKAMMSSWPSYQTWKWN